MSTPHKEQIDLIGIEKVELEIQVVSVAIMGAKYEVDGLQEKLDQLKKQRNELTSGQKHFSLDDVDG